MTHDTIPAIAEQPGLPHYFGITAELLPNFMQIDAIEEMEQLQKSGLYSIFVELSENIQHPMDRRLYRAGFAATVAGVRRWLQANNQDSPTLPNDEHTVSYCIGRIRNLHETQTEQTQKTLLVEHERPLLEAVSEPYDNVPDGEILALYDGVIDAYALLSEATHLRESLSFFSDVNI